MNEINYWEQFTQSGRIEDYLSFKNCDQEQVKGNAEDESYARFSSCNSNSDPNTAYRGI